MGGLHRISHVDDDVDDGARVGVGVGVGVGIGVGVGVDDDVDDDLLSGCINLARPTRDDKMVPHQSNHPVLKMIIIKKSTTLIIQLSLSLGNL